MLTLSQTRTVLAAGVELAIQDCQQHTPVLVSSWARLLGNGLKMPPIYVILDFFGAMMDWNSRAIRSRNLPWEARYRDGLLWDFFYSADGRRLRELAHRLEHKPAILFAMYERFLEIFFGELQAGLEDWYASGIAREAAEDLKNLEAGDLDYIFEDENWWPVLNVSNLIRLYQKKGSFLQEEDFWELSEIEAIPNAALRFAARECRHAQRRIMEEFMDLRRQQRLEDTAFMPDKPPKPGNRPVGGIEGVTQTGRLEGVWVSELMWIGEPTPIGVDLFDLRYVEGELLYQERDNRELDDEVLPIRLQIRGRQFWPGLDRPALKPFVLFGGIGALMEEAARLHTPKRFFWDISIHLEDEAQRELLPVFELHLKRYIDLRRARIRLLPSWQEPSRTLASIFLFGSRVEGCTSLDWEQEKLFFEDPAKNKLETGMHIGGLASWIWQAVRIVHRIAS